MIQKNELFELPTQNLEIDFWMSDLRCEKCNETDF